MRKAGKVFQCRHWTTLAYVSPNLNELQVMAQASGKYKIVDIDILSIFILYYNILYSAFNLLSKSFTSMSILPGLSSIDNVTHGTEKLLLNT